MNPQVYQKLASRTESLRVPDMSNGLASRLLHGCLGMSSEAGEFADVVKRWAYYGQELDTTTAKEKLGDLLWYVALACNALDLELSDVMEANIAKMRNRFPRHFTEFLLRIVRNESHPSDQGPPSGGPQKEP